MKTDVLTENKESNKRLDELYTGALATYADEGDFDVWDWFSEEESEEYKDLLIATGQATKEDF